MRVALPDGYNLNVEEVGTGFPLIVLHGGPGLDHSMFRPYLDSLGDDFRLLYVDERGQGRSERVDPTTLSLEVFARDVELLAEALELDSFALLGHSFGAIITTYHATELGTAAAYVLSGGGDSSEALDADVEASLAALGDNRETITASWQAEKADAETPRTYGPGGWATAPGHPQPRPAEPAAEPQPAPEQLDDAAFWTNGPEGELVPNYDATFPTINEGEVVHGTVVRVDK